MLLYLDGTPRASKLDPRTQQKKRAPFYNRGESGRRRWTTELSLSGSGFLGEVAVYDRRSRPTASRPT
jgi:hypothetical protein